MAKVTGPLMSLDASGTIGKTAVFSKWKGQNYVRLRVVPQNNQTSGQQDARTMLGSVGHVLSLILKPTETDRGSDFYEAGVALAPAGQSWISTAVRSIIGSGGSNFTDKVAEYAVFGAPVKVVFEAAATSLGITDFALAVVGTITSVEGGALVYLLASYAKSVLHDPAAVADFSAVTTGDLDLFIAYCQTIAV